MREPKYQIWHPNEKFMSTVYLEHYLGSRGLLDQLVDNEHGIWREYTGLKDKNGKEYFADDIFLKENTRHIVKWNEDRAGWYLYWADGEACVPFNKILAESANNIGNIYENPKLLEDTK